MIASGKINKVIFENYLQDHKLTVDQFCAMCRISVCRYQMLMNNEINDIETLLKISYMTSISLDEMFKPQK